MAKRDMRPRVGQKSNQFGIPEFYTGIEQPRLTDSYGPSGLRGTSPTHLASGMSAQEYNASNAKLAQGRSADARQQAKQRGGLDAVIQGLKTVPTSRAEDAFFGALQARGVDKLQTGAAAGMDRGPSTYDMTTGATYMHAKPGFFETQVPQQARAYDAREARWGETPEDAPYAQHQRQMAAQNAQALSGLRSGAYDPHAPVAKTLPGADRLARARYLDEEDAKRQRRS